MAGETVTLRNVGGDAVHVLAPAAAAGSFAVAADGEVAVPGVVLAEGDDHYLIGPAGAEVTVPSGPAGVGTEPNPEVLAWPKALWQVAGDKEEDSDA